MSKIKSPSKKYLINRKEFPVTSSRKRKMDFGNRKISNLCPFLKQPFPVEGNVQFLDFEFVQNTKLTPSANWECKFYKCAHSFENTARRFAFCMRLET